MGKPGSKSPRDCKSIASNDLGSEVDGPIETHSTSLGSGEISGYVTSIASPPLEVWYWTISTVYSVMSIPAGEYPCIPLTTS